MNVLAITIAPILAIIKVTSNCSEATIEYANIGILIAFELGTVFLLVIIAYPTPALNQVFDTFVPFKQMRFIAISHIFKVSH